MARIQTILKSFLRLAGRVGKYGPVDNSEIADFAPCAQLTMCTYLLIFIVEQNMVGIDAVVSVHTTRHRADCVKTTSSTKPEVHSVSQGCQVEDLATATVNVCAENLAKIGHVVFEISERTDTRTEDTQTGMLITIFRATPA